MKSPKLSVLTLGIFLASFVVAMMSHNSEAQAFIFSRGPALSFTELTQELKTPKDIAKFMWRNFVFVKDQRQFGTEEYWQSPQEFFGNKKGDCEDFALFAQMLLKANGIRSVLLNVYGKGYGHTVCVYEQDGKYNVIDGTKVIEYKADSLEELSGKIYRHWNKAAVVDMAQTAKRGKILQSFEKKMRTHTTLAAFA